MWNPTSPLLVRTDQPGGSSATLSKNNVTEPEKVETPQQVEFYNEFRAVYTTPASILDTDVDRKNGFVTHRTAWFRSPVEARKKATYRSEEDHAHVIDIEMSWVTRSKPESIGK